MYDDDGEYLGVEETLNELWAEDIIDPDYDYYLEGILYPWTQQPQEEF